MERNTYIYCNCKFLHSAWLKETNSLAHGQLTANFRSQDEKSQRYGPIQTSPQSGEFLVVSIACLLKFVSCLVNVCAISWNLAEQFSR